MEGHNYNRHIKLGVSPIPLTNFAWVRGKERSFGFAPHLRLSGQYDLNNIVSVSAGATGGIVSPAHKDAKGKTTTTVELNEGGHKVETKETIMTQPGTYTDLAFFITADAGARIHLGEKSGAYIDLRALYQYHSDKVTPIDLDREEIGPSKRRNTSVYGGTVAVGVGL